MTIVNGYCTADQLTGITAPTGTGSTAVGARDRRDLAVAAGARSIDRYCDRRFYLDEEATPRLYTARQDDVGWYVSVDDIGSIEDLKIEVGPDTWTEIAESDYELEPINGVSGGIAWPYTRIRLLHNGTCVRNAIRVTARWGWPEIPDDIVSANIAQAVHLFKAPEAAFGFASFDAGVGQMSRYLHPTASMLAGPFRKDPYAA